MPAETLNEEVINILTQIRSLTTWLQALGIVFILRNTPRSCLGDKALGNN